jgi:hypothetical protein
VGIDWRRRDLLESPRARGVRPRWAPDDDVSFSIGRRQRTGIEGVGDFVVVA